MKARSLASIIPVAFLAACASVPSEDFKRIEFVAFDPENITVEEMSKGQAVATGAAVAAGTGVVTSALFSLLCGPYFAVCFAATPAVVGASAVAGGVYAGLADMTVQYDDGFGEFMEPLPSPVDLNQRLVDAVKAKVPQTMIAQQEDADARMILSIYKLRVRKMWGNLSFNIQGSAVYEWKLEQEEPEHYTGFYSCMESIDAPDDWPQDSHDLLSKQLDACVEEIAQRIHDRLTEPAFDPDDVGFSETPY